jgi:serine/threonine protein kinase
MKYIQSWPKRTKMPMSQVFPNADHDCFSLIAALLEFNPKKRLTAEEALAHPYLSAYHHPADEPSHPHVFDVGFEAAQSIDEIKKLIAQTVLEHKKLKALPRGSNPGTPTLSKPILMGGEESGGARYDSDMEAAVAGSIEDEMKELSL